MALVCPRTDPIELGIRSTCKRHRLLEGAIVTLGAVVAALAVALASGQNHGGSSSAQVLRSKVVEVTFAADGGDENRRIFNIGGLIVRASCIDYGGGREYLSVAAKSSIDDASRAVVFSQTRAGQELAYAFRAGDFDADDDWSDFLGTNPYGTTGTLSYARPDGGQVALTFESDRNTPEGDCILRGQATFMR